VFPDLVAEITQLPEFAIDGELVMLDREGTRSFSSGVVR
jgi:ATP-dependent DNA ligase